jgi:hypothetical protein
MEEPYASSCVAFTSSTIALGSLRPDKAKSATGDSVLFSAAVRADLDAMEAVEAQLTDIFDRDFGWGGL